MSASRSAISPLLSPDLRNRLSVLPRVAPELPVHPEHVKREERALRRSRQQEPLRIVELGLVLAFGDESYADIARAKRMLETALKHDPRNVEAMVALGHLYIAGDGATVEEKLCGVDMLRSCAHLDNWHSALGLVYLMDDGHGIEIPPVDTHEFLFQTIENGNPTDQHSARVLLADFLVDGVHGIPQNRQKAGEFYAKASREGWPDGRRDFCCTLKLAKLSYGGYLGQPDYVQIRKTLEILAMLDVSMLSRTNWFDVCIVLSDMYMAGEGGPANVLEAVKLLESALYNYSHSASEEGRAITRLKAAKTGIRHF